MADDLAYELAAGAGHSDNITRVAADEVDETIARAGAKFSFGQTGTRVQTDLVGDLAYYDYLDDTYDSEVLGNFIGSAHLGIVPQRFEWAITDNFGQVLNSPFEPATPETRENINYFTTGPDVLFAFGSQNRLRFGARYANTTYEDSPLDSDGYSADLGFIHQLSAASSLSVNARGQQVEYDDLLDADYDQTDAFLRYALSGARTHVDLDLGYSQLDRDAADKEDGVLARLNASRRVSAASTASLTAGHEFQNSVGAFSSTQSGGAGGNLSTVPGRQTAQPFMSDYVTLGWLYSRVRTNFSLNASLNKQSYDGAPELDQTITLFSGQITRALSPRANLTLQAAYSEGDFDQPDSDYVDMNAGLNFSMRLSTAVTLNMTYDYFDRNGDGLARDYDENRYWISITYGRGTPRSTPLTPPFGVDAAMNATPPVNDPAGS